MPPYHVHAEVSLFSAPWQAVSRLSPVEWVCKLHETKPNQTKPNKPSRPYASVTNFLRAPSGYFVETSPGVYKLADDPDLSNVPPTKVGQIHIHQRLTLVHFSDQLETLLVPSLQTPNAPHKRCVP